MTIAETGLPEFDQEMATTRRVLERVPTDKGKWKPHPKSFTLGHLAQLVAGMPSWIANTVRETQLDLAKYPGYSYEKTEDLVKTCDRLIFTLPRGPVVRQHINHLVHRGQLTVYLRLVDVPVPSIYGPTADEQMPGF
jgi:hypothetical protein